MGRHGATTDYECEEFQLRLRERRGWEMVGRRVCGAQTGTAEVWGVWESQATDIQELSDRDGKGGLTMMTGPTLFSTVYH